MEFKEKRKELLRMDDRALIDRILAFPDREKLNRDEEGKRRQYPSAEMAVRARRSMEKNPDWKISDKQRFVMADSFARHSTDELKVSGITFAKADPRELVKTEAEKDGIKTVYDMEFHLIPEPENEHDRNAVAVYVENMNNEGEVKFNGDTYHGLTKIGYVPGSYVAGHPIVKPMDVKGTLTDHSNGHFKTISYTMNMDTEAVDKAVSAYRISNAYTYCMPFILNGESKMGTFSHMKGIEVGGADDYLNKQYDWTERLNNELEYYGVNGRVDNVRFEFPGGKRGNVIVESSEKLNSEAMTVCGSYFRYCLETRISSDLKHDGYVDVPQNLPAVNTREKTYFSLQAEPVEADDFARAVDSIAAEQTRQQSI